MAAPASPFAHVLGEYDKPDPRDADALAVVETTARGWGATSLRFDTGAVPHSGAHAMYMAWVANKVCGSGPTGMRYVYQQCACQACLRMMTTRCMEQWR